MSELDKHFGPKKPVTMPAARKTHFGRGDWLRGLLFWLVWNVPLGRLAPHILGIALGSKPEVKHD